MIDYSRILVLFILAISAVLLAATWLSPEPYIISINADPFDPIDVAQDPYFWEKPSDWAEGSEFETVVNFKYEVTE